MTNRSGGVAGWVGVRNDWGDPEAVRTQGREDGGLGSIPGVRGNSGNASPPKKISRDATGLAHGIQLLFPFLSLETFGFWWCSLLFLFSNHPAIVLAPGNHPLRLTMLSFPILTGNQVRHHHQQPNQQETVKSSDSGL